MAHVTGERRSERRCCGTPTPPGCFAERGSKLLKRKDGGRRKRAKRLQTPESNGFTTETRQGTELGGDTPSPGVFVSVHSKGVTSEVSVSADSKRLTCTKIVQNARFRGSAESKGVRGAASWRVCSR